MTQDKLTLDGAGRPHPPERWTAAWRWREPKGVTRCREATCRWRWAMWASTLLAISWSAAAIDRVVVPAGVAGVIGYTMTYRADLRGPSDTTYRAVRMPCIGSNVVGCERNGGVMVWSPIPTGGWGMGIALGPGKANTGWLRPVGTIRWTRTTSDGHAINGLTTFTESGAMSSQYMPTPPLAPAGGVVSPSGEGPSGFLFTADLGITADQPNYWSATPIQTAGFNIQYAITATGGGLAPGTYFTSAIDAMLGDFSNGATTYAQLSPIIGVVAANYSCSLAVDTNSISLSPTQTGRATATVACGDVGDLNIPNDAGVVLQASAAGGTTTPSSGKGLYIPSGPGMFIDGTWGANPAACDSGDMYFDGRDGPTLGTISSGDKGVRFTQPMAFRLCGTLTPGQYTAQAIIRVVTR